MPLDGNGNYVRTNGVNTGSEIWQTAALAGAGIIDSLQHDNEMNDVGAAIEAMLARDGQNKMTGPLDMDGNNLDMGGGNLINGAFIDCENIDATPAGNLAYRSTSTDAGTGSGPLDVQRRLSATPAAFDFGPHRQVKFNDSALAEQIALERKTRLLDPTAGAMLAEWVWLAQDGSGVPVEVATIGPLGVKGSLRAGTSAAVAASGATVLISEAYAGAWANVSRITVMLKSIKTDGTDNIEMVIGPSGGVEVTGYDARCSRLASSVVAGPETATDAFILGTAITAALEVSGSIVLTLLDPATDMWSIEGQPVHGGAAAHYVVSGIKLLAGTITQLQLQLAGADLFVSGSVRVMVE